MFLGPTYFLLSLATTNFVIAVLVLCDLEFLALENVVFALFDMILSIDIQRSLIGLRIIGCLPSLN